jgi:predicted dehydrogenase
MAFSKTGLILGCGSIGRRHAHAMALKYEKFSIIDPNKSARDWAIQEFGEKVGVFIDRNDWLGNSVHPDYSGITAVISTWGPSHFEDFVWLADIGIKRIICEKPLANSILKAEKMIAIAKDNNIRTLVGVQRRNIGFYSKTKDEILDYCGGEPVLINVSGGAQCLVTNGMHWLDLACEIFGSLPSRVISAINNEKINPRGESLDFWEGSIVWEYENSRRFSLNLSNHSYLMGEFEIIGPSGKVVIMQNGQIFGKFIEKSNIELGRPFTRTTLVGHEMQSLRSFDSPNPFVNQLEIIDGTEKDIYDFENAAKVLNGMIGALESHLNKSFTNLPITSNLSGYSREWSIS